MIGPASFVSGNVGFGVPGLFRIREVCNCLDSNSISMNVIRCAQTIT
jgi:hypothetical protein